MHFTHGCQHIVNIQNQSKTASLLQPQRTRNTYLIRPCSRPSEPKTPPRPRKRPRRLPLATARGVHDISPDRSRKDRR